RDKVPGLEDEVIKLRENVKEYVKILPDNKEVNEFVKKLSDFARQSNVELVSLKDDNQSNRQRKKEVFDKESFRLKLNGNIFQFLKFISLIENYERFIKISEIALKAGEYDEDTMRSEVVHDVSMRLETFVYHGNMGGETKIQNYEKKREKLIDEIKSARNQIKVERFEYVYDPSIRDPFIDPRTWVSSEEPEGGLELVEQERFLQEMSDKILEINGLLAIVQESASVPLIRRLEIQKEVGERIISLNNQINKSVEEKWITDAACRRKFDSEILPILNEINKNMDFSQSSNVISQEELVYIRDELNRLYQDEDYDACLKRFNLMRSQLGELLKDASQLNPEKNSLLNEIEKIYCCANNAKEFRSIPIKISGIISQNERSIVIVNGQVLSEGQRLQENLTVDKINDKEVFFKYKDQVFKIRP
ncbi:MAG: type 4a pilus biogenesis protein PilO, partial [Planctomycetota bacterium]